MAVYIVKVDDSELVYFDDVPDMIDRAIRSFCIGRYYCAPESIRVMEIVPPEVKG